MDYNDTYTEFLNLYKLSEQPFSPRRSWTTTKEFTPSFKRIKKEFVETPLAPLQGIEPRLPRS